MVRESGRLTRATRIALFTLVVTLGGVAGARAQGVGFQGGMTIDPEQVYVGTHLETKALVDRLHFRPNVEGGFGSDLKVATVNLEFIYKLPLEGTSWTLYQGSGPAIVIQRFEGQSDVKGGLSVVFGFAHANGFFTEFKVGALNTPNLKFGVGYTVR